MAECRVERRSAAQEHFLDLCRLADHPSPAASDPTGGSFSYETGFRHPVSSLSFPGHGREGGCFERGAAKLEGGDGHADVWKRGFFAFEYKGHHKDLQAAYAQLLQYREALDNPPLLVTCDLGRIVVHSNFTATAKQNHEIRLEALGEPSSLEILGVLFHDAKVLDLTADEIRRVVASSKLDRAAIVHGLECGFTGFLPLVGPWQLHGIGLNRFACDLAQNA